MTYNQAKELIRIDPHSLNFSDFIEYRAKINALYYALNSITSSLKYLIDNGFVVRLMQDGSNITDWSGWTFKDMWLFENVKSKMSVNERIYIEYLADLRAC